MYELIKKIILLFVFYFVISVVITSSIYDLDVLLKNSYLKNASRMVKIQADNFIRYKDRNTIFLGTSKTFRNINPIVFDSITGITKSINLGVNNLTPLRSFDFDKYIAKRANNIKYIFYEIRVVWTIGDNYNYIPNIRNLTLPKYFDLIRYFCYSDYYSFKWRLKQCINYSRLFAYKYFTLSALRYWNEYQKGKYFKYSEMPSTGFLPLDKQMKDELDYNYKGTWVEKERFKKWFTPGKMDSKYKRPKIADMKISRAGLMLAEWLDEHLKKTFPDAKIILIIPPRTDKVFQLNMQTQKKYFVGHGYEFWDFSDPKKYPQIYSFESSFDQFHLNSYGAKIYSGILAEKFMDLITGEKK